MFPCPAATSNQKLRMVLIRSLWLFASARVHNEVHNRVASATVSSRTGPACRVNFYAPTLYGVVLNFFPRGICHRRKRPRVYASVGETGLASTRHPTSSHFVGFHFGDQEDRITLASNRTTNQFLGSRLANHRAVARALKLAGSITHSVHSRHRSVDTRANAKLSSLRGPNTGAAPAFHTSAPSSAAGTTRHSSRSGTIVRTHIPGSLYRTVGQHPTRERATGTRHLHVAIDHLYSTAVCRLTRPRFCSEYSAPSAVEFASCICVRHGNHRHSGAYARQKA
jgi:hypothetical protein